MTQGNQPASSIAIFGKSHEVCPVAALLTKHLPAQISLIVVEDIGEQRERAALTLPIENRFHDSIGVSVEDLVQHCNGTLGLGIDCRDLHDDGGSFFAALSGTLPAVNGVALHHIMLRAAHLYHEPEKLAYLFQPFRFGARAALAGKFALPSGDPDSPLTMLGATVQCDRAEYCALLKKHTGKTALHVTGAVPVSLNGEPADNIIRTVQLSDGREISADFFIDVSGTLSSLLPQDQAPLSHSLSDIISFDRLISCFSDKARSTEHGHTSACAIPGGLLMETPVGQGFVAEFLYSSKVLSDEKAQKIIGGEAQAMGFAARFTDSPWAGNMARLGSASAQLGPYLSADMRLLQDQALHLAEILPATLQMDIEATEFNRRHLTSVEQIRDFILLPLALNSRSDSPWADMRGTKLPESLQLRLDQFKSRGRFVTFDNELFDQQLWIDMMIELRLVPERYDPIASSFDLQRISPILKKIVDAFTDAIDTMPRHSDFMENFVIEARQSKKVSTE